MSRKLFVHVLTVAVLSLLGGAALAATGVPMPFLPDAASDSFVMAAETATARPETDTVRPDNFGQARSEEVRAFGECMRAADSAEARAACHDAKHGPATENPAHPVFGEAGTPEELPTDDPETTAQEAPPADLPSQAQHGQQRAAEAHEHGQAQRDAGQQRAEEARAQRPTDPGDNGQAGEPAGPAPQSG
ncbi:MAG: hypothetical protein M3N52_01645, partial [Actinomycetota bacterium]|nr:hypothetical protein [Actinomycetota bacterium]